MFEFPQQFRKYTPPPERNLTEPVPFITSLPLRPEGATAGLTVAPFETPLTSLASPRIESSVVIVGRTSEMLAEAEEARSEAEITAVWDMVKGPAVAVNEAEVELTGTVTDAGTVTSLLLTARPTADPPAGAVWESVTVQVVLAFGASVVRAQVRDLSVSGATSEIVADCEDPFKDAVTVAV